MKPKSTLRPLLSALGAATLAISSAQGQTTYTGDNTTGADRWNNPANWDNGVPVGSIDVIIPDGKFATAWSNSTPVHSGDISIGVNSLLKIGHTTVLPLSSNALGTPGTTTISLASGSQILTRNGGTFIMPAIHLLGNATVGLGESTQTPAVANFNYGMTGSHQFTITSNGQGANPIANFNASNAFSSMVIRDIAGRGNPADTFRATIADSLGLGNVSIQSNGESAALRSPMLWVAAPHAMSILGTLSITGGGTTNAGTNKLRLDENMTVAGLVLDGVAQAAGTYGKIGSGADFEVGWLNTSGNGILTVETPNVAYWDINGTTAGAGGATPGGIWNTTNTFWNPDADGTGSTAAWTAGKIAVFSAGSDATGTYNVEVEGSQDIGGIIVHNGSVNLTEGTGGALRLVDTSNLNIALGSTSSIATNIGEDASARLLSKSGGGTLTLSGDLSHTGGTALYSGNLILSGDNSAAIGGTTIANGILQVDSAAAIPGTTRDLTISAPGTLVFGAGFGAGNIQTALDERVVAGSAGTIAADNFGSTNFDFSSAGLTSAYLGAVGNVGYTGTLTPQGATYRLGGGGGTLTMANANAVTGANSLIARGNVVLALNNDYTGTTTVSADSSLTLLGSTTTSGITVNTGSTLTLGNNGSLGSGTLTLAGAGTLQAVGTVVTTNAVAANADFTIAGTGNLTLGDVTVNNNRIINNSNSTGITTLGAIGVTSGNRNLTFNSVGDTIVSGAITTGSGTLAKNDAGTLTLQGANSYSGTTTVSGGTLVISGSNSSAGQTTVNAGTLQLNSASNGGLASGQLSLSQNAAVLQAVNADRAISNLVLLNASPTISGTQSLTLNASLRLNNNRILTNNISGTGKHLTIAVVDRTDATNRNFTVAGTGNTHVVGDVDLGTGTLTKNGAGTLTLSGTTSYSGTTTINNDGTLLINGSIGAGAVTVNNTATLGGSGSIGGNVTITATANLAPGAAVGTLAVGGDLTISAMANSTGKLIYEIDAIAASDRVTVAGTLNIGTGILGFSDFDFSDVGGLEEGVYTLLTSGTLNGTLDGSDLTGTIGSFDAELGTSGNNIILTVGTPSGTPYETWSGNLPFDADANGDGVSNGLAFLLGAAGPNANALGLLPTATETAGGLVLTFQMLNAASRGDATLGIEHSSDLGIADAWTLVGVPDASGGPTSGVTFTVTPGSPTNTVTATIAPSEAAGGKLFGRLKGVDP